MPILAKNSDHALGIPGNPGGPDVEENNWVWDKNFEELKRALVSGRSIKEEKTSFGAMELWDWLFLGAYLFVWTCFYIHMCMLGPHIVYTQLKKWNKLGINIFCGRHLEYRRTSNFFILLLIIEVYNKIKNNSH